MLILVTTCLNLTSRLGRLTAQWAKRPALDLGSRFVGSSPASGSALTAGACLGFGLSLSLSAPPPSKQINKKILTLRERSQSLRATLCNSCAHSAQNG